MNRRHRASSKLMLRHRHLSIHGFSPKASHILSANDQVHAAKLLLANQQIFFDQSPDAASGSGMNSVENMNIFSVRLRHPFEIIIVFCALGSWLPDATVARDIYLPVRQDGHRGSGSAQDPFDASSAAKYDAILGRFREATNFIYSPGIYGTKGWYDRTRQIANPHCHRFGDTGLKPGDQRPTIAKIIFKNNQINQAEPSTEKVERIAGLTLVSPETRYSVGELLLEDNVFRLPARPGNDHFSRTSGAEFNSTQERRVK
jgi:hypothetical protein